MASSLDNVGSSPPLQKLVNLPPEEANKAPFPPGCKVICFMKDGTPNVGTVKSVQLSISFKAGGTFNTYYQVEIQRSWRDPKSQEISVCQVEADDLRLTPGSPVYISSHYFGTDSDLLEGREGLIEGVLLGCFDIPCMNCRKDSKKTADDMTSKRRFSYSVEFKMNGVEEVAEEHGVPPEFVTYRSTKLAKKEGVVAISLEDIGINIVPTSGILQKGSDGVSSAANTTTRDAPIHVTNRDEATAISNRATSSTLTDVDSDARKRPTTNAEHTSTVDIDFYRSFSFDKNFNSTNKVLNNNGDQLSNSDGSTRIDYSFSNNSVRTFFSQQRSPNMTTEHDNQSSPNFAKRDASIDARFQSHMRTSNPERGILRSSSVDRRTSFGRSNRYNVTFADNDEVHEHLSESRANSGVFPLAQANILLNTLPERTFTPSKHAIEYMPTSDNRTRVVQQSPAIESQGYESAMSTEKNQVSRMNSNETDYTRNYSDRSKESNDYEIPDYDGHGSVEGHQFTGEDMRRRISDNNRTSVEPQKINTPKGTSSQEPTFSASQDNEAQHRERMYSQQQGSHSWGDIRRSQSYDVNASNETPYVDRWETRSSYDQTRWNPQGQSDSSSNYKEQPKSQNFSYPSRSPKEETQQNINSRRGFSRYQESMIGEMKENEGSPRRSNDSTAEKSEKGETRRNSTDGSFQRLNESTAGKFAIEDTRRHSTDGSTHRSYEETMKIKSNYDHNRRQVQPEDVHSNRPNQNETLSKDNLMENSPPRKTRWNNSAVTNSESKASTSKDDAQRSSSDINNRQGKHDDAQKRSMDGRNFRINQQFGLNGSKPDYKNGSNDDHHWNQQADYKSDKVVIENIQRSRSELEYKDDDVDKKSDVSPSSVIVRVETKDSDPKEDPTPERNDEEGCYLVYTEDSGGKLVLNYSRSVIEDAVGFWMPQGGKKFQGFKFTHNQGKVDLIKGIAGGDSNRRKYYHGWCQFFKAAATSDGLICKRPARGGIEVDLWVFYNETCTIEKVEDLQFFDATRIYAIACVPKNTMLFNGMKTSELGQFLQKGQLAGASITIDGNV